MTRRTVIQRTTHPALRSGFACCACVLLLGCSQPAPKAVDGEPSAAEPEPVAVAAPASSSAPATAAPPSDPLVHEYLGAVVRIGEAPPWSTLDAGAEFPVLGTARTEVRSLPTKLRAEWRANRTIQVPEKTISAADFSPDRTLVATLGPDSGKLHLFDVARGKLVETRRLEDFTAGEPASFTFVTEVVEQDRIVVARKTGAFLVFREPEKVRRLGNAAAGTDVVHTKREGLYGVDDLNQEGGRHIYLQWVTGQLAASIECKRPTRDWSLSADGKTLALLYPEDHIVEILDIEQRRLLAEVQAPPGATSIAVAPSGHVVALGGESLVVFSLQHGKVVAVDESFEKPITTVHFTPLEDLLLVSSKEGKVRSYALPTALTELEKLPRPQILSHGPNSTIHDARPSWDGRMLVTAGSDRTLRIWTR